MTTWQEAQQLTLELNKVLGERKSSLPQPLVEAFDRVVHALEEGITEGPGTRQKGRKVPPLPTFTFPTSGITVSVRRLGPFVMDDIQQRLKKERAAPKPPMVSVEVGEERVRLLEANPRDPAYVREYQEWLEWLNNESARRLIDLMLHYCIVCEPDLEAVAEARLARKLIDNDDTVDDASDLEIYARFVLVQSPQDLTTFQSFVLSQSMPTEAVVQEHLETFPPTVPGETAVPAPSAEVGSFV